MTLAMNITSMNCPDECQGIRYDTYRSNLGPVVLHKDFSDIIRIFKEKMDESTNFGLSSLDSLNEFTNRFTDTTNYLHTTYKKTLADAYTENNYLKVALTIMTIVAIALGIALFIVVL